jgi:hypothetical protein
MTRIAFLAFALTLAAAEPLLACSCIEMTPRDAREASPAVLIGKVIRLEVIAERDGINEIAADVKVLRSVKGDVGEKVRFLTSDGCCYCAFSFTIGETYLLYASKDGAHFATSTCMRSQPIARAAEDLRALNVDWQTH